MSQHAAPASDEVAALRAALAAEQSARREAEARASGAEAMGVHLKLLIAKLRQDRFGASSERGRKLLDQMELELEELEAAASEDEAQVGVTGQDNAVASSVGAPCAARCPTISPGSAWWCRAPRPAQAAAASSPSWARASPKPWRSYPGNGR